MLIRKITSTVLLIFIIGTVYATGTSKVIGFDFAHKIGSYNSDLVKDIEYDNRGNVFVLGSFNNTVDFDFSNANTSLTSVGNNDVFIAKYDTSGNFQWVNQLGSNGNDFASDLAVDPYGNVIAVGNQADSTTTRVKRGTTYITAHKTKESGGFVVKYDPLGQLLWRANQNSSSGINNGVGVDELGNVYISGKSSGNIDFDPTPQDYIVNMPIFSQFVLKLTPIGTFEWVEIFECTNFSQVMAVGVTDAGSVIVGGNFRDTLIVEDVRVKSKGSYDNYLIKYNTNGDVEWVNTYGGFNQEFLEDIRIGNNDDVFVVGQFSSTVEFGNGAEGSSLTALNNYDGYALNLDSNGNFKLVKRFGTSGAGTDIASSVYVEPNGNFLVSGIFNGLYYFDDLEGDRTLSTNGNGDIFLAKFDKDGNTLWFHSIEGQGNEDVETIYEDENGNIYLGGNFWSTVDFDPNGTKNELTARYNDGFILKLNQTICADFAIIPDSLSNIGCNDSAYISFEVIGTNASYDVNYEGGIVNDGYFIQPTFTGYQTFSATDQNGCIDHFSANITDLRVPNMGAYNVDIGICGHPYYVDFYGGDPDSVVWEDGTNSRYKAFTTPGGYPYTAYKNNCSYPQVLKVDDLMPADSFLFYVQIDDATLANSLDITVNLYDSLGNVIKSADYSSYYDYGEFYDIGMGVGNYTVGVNTLNENSLRDYYVAYADSAFTIDQARFSSLNCYNNERLTIFLNKKAVLNGNYEISGHIWEITQQESYCSTIGASRLRLILVTDDNKVVDYYQVIGDGVYKFENLESGIYSVYVEQIGVYYDNSNPIKIEVSNESVTNLDLLDQGDKISLCDLTTSTGQAFSFPTLNWTINENSILVSTERSIAYQLTDLTGTIVELGSGVSEFSIDTQLLNNGLYLLTFFERQYSKTEKVLIK